MRNIKFRAWDVKDKEFLEVGRLYQEDEIYVVEEHPDCGDRVLFVGESGGERKNEVELMQYTGLKDKNGVEIYEGDIVENASKDLKFQVVYKAPSFCRKWIDDVSKRYHDPIEPIAWNTHIICEVIGNIYENPELLGDSQ